MKLYRACFNGDLPRVTNMLHKRKNIPTKAMIGAIKGGKIDIVQLLISEGIEMRYYFFELACKQNQFDIVKLLTPILFNSINSYYWTFITDVTLLNYINPEIIEYLFDTFINDQNKINHILSRACFLNDVKIAKIAISRGANNVNHELGTLCCNGPVNVEMALLLIQNGASSFLYYFYNINRNGNLTSDLDKHTELIKLILNKIEHNQSKKFGFCLPLSSYIPDDGLIPVPLCENLLWSGNCPKIANQIPAVMVLMKNIEEIKSTIREILDTRLPKVLIELITDYFPVIIE